jgi:hypothetical protein
MLRNVIDEFNSRLDVGAVHSSLIIPEYKEKLEANGLAEYTEELNRQIKAFLESR